MTTYAITVFICSTYLRKLFLTKTWWVEYSDLSIIFTGRLYSRKQTSVAIATNKNPLLTTVSETYRLCKKCDVLLTLKECLKLVSNGQSYRKTTKASNLTRCGGLLNHHIHMNDDDDDNTTESKSKALELHSDKRSNRCQLVLTKAS